MLILIFNFIDMSKNKIKYTVIQGLYKWVITLAPIGGWEAFDVKEAEYNSNYKDFTQED